MQMLIHTVADDYVPQTVTLSSSTSSQAKEMYKQDKKDILKSWQRLLPAGGIHVYQRSQIAEAAFAKKTSQPAVYIGFKSSYRSEGDPDALFGSSAKGIDHGATFLFPSDSVREQWRSALNASLAPLVISGTSDDITKRKKASRDHH